MGTNNNENNVKQNSGNNLGLLTIQTDQIAKTEDYQQKIITNPTTTANTFINDNQSNPLNNNNNNNQQNQPNLFTYICKICEQTFDDKQEALLHIILKHRNLVKDDINTAEELLKIVPKIDVIKNIMSPKIVEQVENFNENNLVNPSN